MCVPETAGTAAVTLSGENECMFDVLRGLAIIVAIFLIGGWLHTHGVPIPGGVLGLLLFYGAMLTGVLKLAWVDRTAGLLLRHMVLLFVPLTVGLMDLGGILARQAAAILVSLVVSFLAVLLTTGLLARWLLHPAPETEEAGQ
jgi:holin-like protein